jgi:hypothetical protein
MDMARAVRARTPDELEDAGHRIVAPLFTLCKNSYIAFDDGRILVADRARPTHGAPHLTGITTMKPPIPKPYKEVQVFNRQPDGNWLEED